MADMTLKQALQTAISVPPWEHPEPAKGILIREFAKNPDNFWHVLQPLIPGANPCRVAAIVNVLRDDVPHTDYKQALTLDERVTTAIAPALKAMNTTCGPITPGMFGDKPKKPRKKSAKKKAEPVAKPAEKPAAQKPVETRKTASKKPVHPALTATKPVRKKPVRPRKSRKQRQKRVAPAGQTTLF